MRVDRRGFTRRKPEAGEPLERTRLRAGPELDVIDISDGGVRATTSSRLLPGTHVDVHVVTRVGRVLQRARVVRASVTVIDAQRLVYEVALGFDAPIRLSTGAGSPYPVATRRADVGARNTRRRRAPAGTTGRRDVDEPS